MVLAFLTEHFHGHRRAIFQLHFLSCILFQRFVFWKDTEFVDPEVCCFHPLKTEYSHALDSILHCKGRKRYLSFLRPSSTFTNPEQRSFLYITRVHPKIIKMLPSIFLLSESGELLLEKRMGPRLPRKLCEIFLEQVSMYTNPSSVPSILLVSQFYIINIFHTCAAPSPSNSDKIPTLISSYPTSGIWVFTAVEEETNALLALEHLETLIERLELYLGEKFTASKVTSEFTLVHLAIDEMFDAGFAFTTEPNQLLKIVPPPSHPQSISTVFMRPTTSELLQYTTNSSIPWRRNDCKYPSNTFSLKIVESIDAILRSDGKVVHSFIRGTLKCDCKLSGTPDVSLELSNPIFIQNASLHRCVRVNKFNSSGILSFIPQDGQFDLAEYSIPGPEFFPISVTASIGPGTVMIRMSCSHSPIEDVSNILMKICFPKETFNLFLNSSEGTVRVDQDLKTVYWQISRFTEDVCPYVEGTFAVPETSKSTEKPQIQLKFKVNHFSASDVTVESIDFRNIDYKPSTSVELQSETGEFYIRT